MQAIEAKRAKDQLEEKEPEKKVSKTEKKKLDFEKKWREQVYVNVLPLYIEFNFVRFFFKNRLSSNYIFRFHQFSHAVLVYFLKQEAKRDDPDGSKAKAKAAKKAESYIAEERRLHEAYQILRTEADNKRKQRNEAKKMMGISIDKPTDEIKVVDDMETEDAKRDDFGIIQSTSIPLEF